MLDGSWLMAQGSWPREARGGSWLMARCRPGPGEHASRTSNIEKSRKIMFLRFCGTRCRGKKGGWVQELFPTIPTYQNPTFISPGPLLCKVSWFFGFHFLTSVLYIFGPIGPIFGPIGLAAFQCLCWHWKQPCTARDRFCFVAIGASKH